jgi:hypothetical protein
MGDMADYQLDQIYDRDESCFPYHRRSYRKRKKQTPFDLEVIISGKLKRETDKALLVTVESMDYDEHHKTFGDVPIDMWFPKSHIIKINMEGSEVSFYVSDYLATEKELI